MLQAAVLGKIKPQRTVRNEMENGYTEGNVKPETHLTEPQGIIKIFAFFARCAIMAWNFAWQATAPVVPMMPTYYSTFIRRRKENGRNDSDN